jgi:hypothetical protein
VKTFLASEQLFCTRIQFGLNIRGVKMAKISGKKRILLIWTILLQLQQQIATGHPVSSSKNKGSIL